MFTFLILRGNDFQSGFYNPDSGSEFHKRETAEAIGKSRSDRAGARVHYQRYAVFGTYVQAKRSQALVTFFRLQDFHLILSNFALKVSGTGITESATAEFGIMYG